jgi:hypothetical protein
MEKPRNVSTQDEVRNDAVCVAVCRRPLASIGSWAAAAAAAVVVAAVLFVVRACRFLANSGLPRFGCLHTGQAVLPSWTGIERGELLSLLGYVCSLRDAIDGVMWAARRSRTETCLLR